ncbi:hypothetical protein [Arthrobacter cavernae]|uniref:Uncharacterized protein n=1 Tax=Arthrobacter cavernae TaxID=2817681 RepID=A0A939HA35_9MICC|nr:hypothetical protein [Arthrobacter cavernae]MBO1267092.1 hypothetical protein [Arthrobacter cavernae]
MPANPTTSNNFLVTTDYPLDKVVVGGTANFTVPANTTGVGRLAHKLPFAPLMMGSYSLTSDYAVLYGLNTAPVSLSPALRLYDYIVNINSDANDIIFSGENYTGSPITFYVRYYGLEPSTVDADLLRTQSNVDNFQLNTDYNYTKLYLSDYFEYPSSPSTTSVTTIIPHGLGRVPQVMTWSEKSGTIAPLSVHDAGDLQAEPIATSVDATNLIIKTEIAGGTPTIRVHYRVYLDA